MGPPEPLSPFVDSVYIIHVSITAPLSCLPVSYDRPIVEHCPVRTNAPIDGYPCGSSEASAQAAIAGAAEASAAGGASNSDEGDTPSTLSPSRPCGSPMPSCVKNDNPPLRPCNCTWEMQRIATKPCAVRREAPDEVANRGRDRIRSMISSCLLLSSACCSWRLCTSTIGRPLMCDSPTAVD